jgi:flavin reductase
MVESEEFRGAMSRLGAAVNLITSAGPAGRYGMTASAVCSVTDNPPTLLVCINRSATANPIVKANGVLAVNVLAGRHATLSDRFAGRVGTAADRFAEEAAWTELATGSPILKDASAALDCSILSVSEVGSHSVFFCRVLDIRLAEAAEGLIYFNHAYHPLANGAAT